MIPNPVGLQLYSLRDMAAHDFTGMLTKVAQVGYKAVEFAGHGPSTPSELRRLLDRLGLRSAGSHLGVAALQNDFDNTMETLKTIGSAYAIIGGVPQEYRTDASGWRRFGQLLGELSPKCRKHGITLCYHNHSFEFAPVDGSTGYDLMFEAAPAEVQAEIDVYWVQHAGLDPAQLVRRMKGRCPLLHAKDMDKSDRNSDTEIGNGQLDWNAIFAAAEEAGTQWYIVEQEQYKYPPIECVRISLENLRKMGIQ